MPGGRRIPAPFSPQVPLRPSRSSRFRGTGEILGRWRLVVVRSQGRVDKKEMEKKIDRVCI